MSSRRSRSCSSSRAPDTRASLFFVLPPWRRRPRRHGQGGAGRGPGGSPLRERRARWGAPRRPSGSSRVRHVSAGRGDTRCRHHGARCTAVGLSARRRVARCTPPARVSPRGRTRGGTAVAGGLHPHLAEDEGGVVAGDDHALRRRAAPRPLPAPHGALAPRRRPAAAGAIVALHGAARTGTAAARVRPTTPPRAQTAPRHRDLQHNTFGSPHCTW